MIGIANVAKRYLVVAKIEFGWVSVFSRRMAFLKTSMCLGGHGKCSGLGNDSTLKIVRSSLSASARRLSDVRPLSSEVANVLTGTPRTYRPLPIAVQIRTCQFRRLARFRSTLASGISWRLRPDTSRCPHSSGKGCNYPNCILLLLAQGSRCQLFFQFSLAPARTARFASAAR